MCILMYYICARCYCGHPQFTEPCPQAHPFNPHCPAGKRFKFLIVDEKACHLHPHHAPLPGPGATRGHPVIPGSQPGSWPVIDEVVTLPFRADGNATSGNREAPNGSQIKFGDTMGSPRPVDAQHEHMMRTGQPGGYNNWYAKEHKWIQTGRTNQHYRAHGPHPSMNDWNGPIPSNHHNFGEPHWQRHPHDAAPPPFWPDAPVQSWRGNGPMPPNGPWDYQHQAGHPEAGHLGSQQMAPTQFPGQPPYNNSDANHVGDFNHNQPFGPRINPGPSPEKESDSGRQTLRQENSEQPHKSDEAAHNHHQSDSRQSVSDGDKEDVKKDVPFKHPVTLTQRRRSKSWSEPYSPHGVELESRRDMPANNDSIEKEDNGTAADMQKVEARVDHIRGPVSHGKIRPSDENSKPCTTSRELKIPNESAAQATYNNLLEVTAKLEALRGSGQKSQGEDAVDPSQKPQSNAVAPKTWSAVVAGRFIPSRSPNPFPTRYMRPYKPGSPSIANATGGTTPKSMSEISATPPSDIPRPPTTTPRLSPAVADTPSTQSQKERQQLEKKVYNPYFMTTSTAGATRNTSPVSMPSSSFTSSTTGQDPPILTPQSSPERVSQASTPERVMNDSDADDTDQSTPKQVNHNVSLARARLPAPNIESDAESMIAHKGSVYSASDSEMYAKPADAQNTQTDDRIAGTSAGQSKHQRRRQNRGRRYTPQTSGSESAQPEQEGTAKSAAKRTANSQRRHRHRYVAPDQQQANQEPQQVPQRRLWSDLVGGSSGSGGGAAAAARSDNGTAAATSVPDADKDENSWPSLDSAKNVKGKRKWSKPRE